MDQFENATSYLPSLWLPGQSLDHEYPEITQPELISVWGATHKHDEVISAEDVLSALNVPEFEPRIIASVDLCEVVRETFYSMVDLFGITKAQLKGTVSDYA